MKLNAKSFLAVFFSLFLVPAIASGVEFRSGERVVVAEGEVVEGDIYLTGGIIEINGVVRGDVVAAGREVVLNGRADGDFIASGQSVVVLGAVGDDVRAAGMALRLGPGATVAGHLVSASYSFETEPGSRVEGFAAIVGSKARLAGDFGSGLRVSASAVEISGQVVDDVDVKVTAGMEGGPWFESFFPETVELPTIESGLTVADPALIGGRLSYSAPEEGAVDAAAVSGPVEWEKSEFELAEAEPAVSLGSRIAAQVRRFAALLLFGVVLVWRARAWADGRSKTLVTKPVGSLGWGLAGFVGLPLGVLAILGLTILLAILTGSLFLGRWSALIVLLGLVTIVLLTVSAVLIAMFVAPVLVALTLGGALVQRMRPAQPLNRYLAVTVGLLVVVLLTSLPAVGSALGVLVVVLGLGAVVQWLLALRRSAATG